MEKLDSLRKMLENGLISQEEFDAKKKELIEKM
ncbi:MAG: SHOCT domain-containing protein [Ruminococcus sp.]|nr:SHOCT domain-containing protein [Ruminococcus sp.]